MKKSHNKRIIYFASALIIFLAFFSLVIHISPSADAVRLVLDNMDHTAAASPVIRNGRVLVPVRYISENLGAQVVWNETARTVSIQKDGMSVLLRIDSHLVRYFDQNEFFELCDVVPVIINSRTYVPLRLVSNALGITVKWDSLSKTVYLDSEQKSEYASFFDLKLATLKAGQVIKGTVALRTAFPGQIPAGAVEIKYLLLNKNTAKGIVIMRGDQIADGYEWKPEPAQNGDKLIVAAVYDINGNFLAGASIPVRVAVEPKLSVTGIVEEQEIVESVSLGVSLDFSAYYVKYVITNLDNGRVFASPETDPQGKYTWSPMMEDNGDVSIKAIAYDINGRSYESPEIQATVTINRKLSLSGVPSGRIIDGEITLSTARNFQVSQTEYVMKDLLTGTETVLIQIGYGNYKWFPGPELKGAKGLYVRVKNVYGVTHQSETINVEITGNPRIRLEGIGPNQVVTGTVKLKANSNVSLDSVKYILVNTATWKVKTITSSEFTPAAGDAGYWKIHAEGIYAGSKKVIGSEISFRIYTGRTYPPVPIVEKSKFIALISEMAIETQKKTGMSAALQIAQAILETGWGQNIPVDKYSGLVSYNLFGIKGTGPAGSVISNTWEEYNGVAYRIDDKFRAYSNIQDSWADHKKLLLTASRYEIFRDVMHDSTLGAFALRRAGYATDSRYPFKLIDIIKIYDLIRFDESGI